MGVFATLTDVTSEIKAAAEAEVLEPGSGAVLVTFTDAEMVNTAADAAALDVFENLQNAEMEFEAQYESFLEEFPMDEELLQIIEEKIEGELTPAKEGDELSQGEEDTLADGVDTIKEVEDPVTDIIDPDKESDDLIKDTEDDKIVEDDASTGFGGGGGGGGAPAVAQASVLPIISVITGGTQDAKNLDFYLDFSGIESRGIDFMGLTSYKIDVNINGGWAASVDAMSGSTGFSWTNSLSLVNASSTTVGVLSTNNLLSNSEVGSVVLISGEDLSGGSRSQLKLGTMTLDIKDAKTIGSVSGTVDASFSDVDGELASVSDFNIDVY